MKKLAAAADQYLNVVAPQVFAISLGAIFIDMFFRWAIRTDVGVDLNVILGELFNSEIVMFWFWLSISSAFLTLVWINHARFWLGWLHASFNVFPWIFLIVVGLWRLTSIFDGIGHSVYSFLFFVAILDIIPSVIKNMKEEDAAIDVLGRRDGGFLPIRNFASQDKFERSSLVETIEKILKNKASSVIAIDGKWGSGKTSVILEIMARLRRENSHAVVALNSWFIREGVDSISQTLNDLVVECNRIQFGSASLKKILGWLNEASVLHASLSAWRLLYKPQTQKDLIQDLKQSVSSFHLPIVIFVDDVDRLPKAEIEKIIKLIALIDGIPGLVVICAVDTKSTESLLGCHSDYLAKIFPVRVFMPDVSPLKGWSMFESECVSGRRSSVLVNLLSDVNCKKNAKRLWLESVGYLLNTPRLLIQFIASMEAECTVEIVEEIDPADLIVLMALKVSYPEVYRSTVKYILSVDFSRDGAYRELPEPLAGELIKIIEKKISDLEMVHLSHMLCELLPAFKRKNNASRGFGAIRDVNIGNVTSRKPIMSLGGALLFFRYKSSSRFLSNRFQDAIDEMLSAGNSGYFVLEKVLDSCADDAMVISFWEQFTIETIKSLIEKANVGQKEIGLLIRAIIRVGEGYFKESDGLYQWSLVDRSYLFALLRCLSLLEEGALAYESLQLVKNVENEAFVANFLGLIRNPPNQQDVGVLGFEGKNTLFDAFSVRMTQEYGNPISPRLPRSINATWFWADALGGSEKLKSNLSSGLKLEVFSIHDVAQCLFPLGGSFSDPSEYLRKMFDADEWAAKIKAAVLENPHKASSIHSLYEALMSKPKDAT